MPRKYDHKLNGPPEIIGPSGTRSVLASILGPLLILLLLNAAAVAFLKTDERNFGSILIRKKWEMAQQPQKPVDWLILGDSTGNQGVIPAQFARELGGTSLNLCILADLLAINDAWMLDRYIEKHGAPKNVVLVHGYKGWDREGRVFLLSKIPLEWGFWDRMNPPWNLTAGETRELFLFRYAPLYSEHRTLSDRFRYPWKGNQNNGVLQDDGFLRTTEPNIEEVEMRTSHFIEYFRTTEFRMSERNRQALDRIAEVTRNHGIEVYLVNGPLYEGVSRSPDFRNHFRGVQDALSAYSEKHPHIHFLMKDPMTFPANQMQTPGHLIHSAAKTFTARLISEIKQIQN
jgi:hypothetical protein